MKLNIPAVLVALFCGLSNALNTHVKIADVPSYVEVGQQIRLRWSNDRDYVRTVLPASRLLTLLRKKALIYAPQLIRPIPESERIRPLQVRKQYQEAQSQRPTPVGLGRGQSQHDLDGS
jgi:hypothetical protein